MFKMFKRIRNLQGIDNELLRKNIIPMVFCFGIWAVGIFFLLSHMKMGIAATTTFLLVTVQLISSLKDLYSRTIPIRLMIFVLMLGLIMNGIYYKNNTLINCILGGISAFVVMTILRMVSKKQMGGGDLALMTVTGFFAGITAFFSILFAAIVLAGMYSLFLVFAKKGSRKTEIPFAPFILLATVSLVVCG